MPNLKDIRNRIESVKKTRQITSAMKLVATAKMKSAIERAVSARPYRTQLAEVLRSVAAAAGEDSSEPLLEARPNIKRVMLVVMTSDRGLCGPFNNGLLRLCEPWIAEQQEKGHEVVLRVYGRKAAEFFPKRGHEVSDAVVGYANTHRMDMVRPLTDVMVASFIDGDVDEVYLAYNRFINTLVQRPGFERMLPLVVEGSEDAEDGDEAQSAHESANFRFEPGAPQILQKLLPLYLRTLVLQAFFETEAGEYAARMAAMDNATRNAGDMIDALTLQFNRARQAAITTEIIEIVSGASAL